MSAEFNDLEQLKPATAMNMLDKLSCVGLLGGTAASLVMQQAAFATIPISVLLTLQIFSRQQKVTALVEACHQTSQSVQSVKHDLDHVSQQCQGTLQEQEEALNQLTQENNQQSLEFITIKERIEEQSKHLAKHSGQLDALDETLSSVKKITASSGSAQQSASAQDHFIRGVNQEKLGHFEVAIEDYSQAINQQQDYAEAYLRRGLAKSELGRKQSAVIDLNLATKHFFESGDLVNYQRAKNIAINIHRVEEGDETSEAENLLESQRKSELVSIQGLFGD